MLGDDLSIVTGGGSDYSFVRFGIAYSVDFFEIRIYFKRKSKLDFMPECWINRQEQITIKDVSCYFLIYF